jgi:hypothetical protein
MVCYIYSQLVMVRSIELYLYKHHTRILDVLSWSFVGKLSLIDKVALIGTFYFCKFGYSPNLTLLK